MRKKILLGGTVGLAFLASASAFYTLARREDKVLPQWQTVPVVRTTLSETVSATGLLSTDIGGTVDVGFEFETTTTGIIDRLLVDEGDRVKQGDLLARVDQTRARIAVARAEADLLQAKAELDFIRRGSREEEIRNRRHLLKKAKANLSLQEELFRRDERLLAQGAVSREQVDRSRTAFEAAQAEYNSALEQLKLAEEKYTPEEIRRAEARAMQAESALRDARKRLQDTELRAPISGTVARRYVEVGQAVRGGEKIFTITDPKHLRLELNVDEVDVGKVRVGQPVEFSVYSYPDKTFRGQVTWIAPLSTPISQVVYYKTYVAIEDPGRLLRSGMTANAKIFVFKKENALVLPSSAVKESGSKRLVYVLQEGRPSPREVQVSASTKEQVEILEGLAEGEEVVLGEVEAKAASPKKGLFASLLEYLGFQ